MIEPQTSHSADSEAREPSTGFEPNRLAGVGGWLLYLCIGLTILAPGFRVVGVARDVARLQRLSGSWRTWVISAQIARVVATAFMFYAGVSLWRVRPGAVGKAMAAIAVAAVVEVTIQIGRVFFFGSTLDTNRTIAAIAWAILWTWYLSVSERVHNTYLN